VRARPQNNYGRDNEKYGDAGPSSDHAVGG